MDRKKLHPVIRMEDVLNTDRCDTLDNVVGNMTQRVLQNNINRVSTTAAAADFAEEAVDGMWYNIPIAMSRERHLRTEEQWQHMLARLRNQIGVLADKHILLQLGQPPAEEGSQLHWHVDLFPASRKFVVYHVLKSEAGNRKLDALNNHDYDENNAMDMGMPKADPIYHMYLECRTKKEDRGEDGIIMGSSSNDIAGRNLKFMDVMYNRWAVQNGAMLRKRILEKKAEELSYEKNQNKFGANRGAKTRQAIAMARAAAASPQNQGYAPRRW